MVVLAWWLALAMVAALYGPTLSEIWVGWSSAALAAAVWGLNLLMLRYGIGPPYRLSRLPVVVAGFALLMTLFGSGSYWATIQLYPGYRVGIERAALLVAVCTAITLTVAAGVQRGLRARGAPAAPLEWDFPRVRVASTVLFVVAMVGTLVTVRRIGYLPILTGDPASARVDFPSLGGVWYRLSMLGGLVALLVAAQAAARRATWRQYVMGIASLLLVGVYGPRFFVALPLGVAVLLWDRVRARIRVFRVALMCLVAIPALTVVGYWRERDPHLGLLGPLGLAFYGTLGEFRDLGWAVDYYGFGDRYLHGATFGSVVVPLLPAPVWQTVGIDKSRIYAQSSASFLADAMGQTTGQRIGVFGEFFMNFGWLGAWFGAAGLGMLVGYLDDRFGRVTAVQVRGLFLSLASATTAFALIGQLDMFTSTLTGVGYPLAVVVLFTARRSRSWPGDTGIPA